jgi:hypothetical protein
MFMEDLDKRLVSAVKNYYDKYHALNLPGTAFETGILIVIQQELEKNQTITEETERARRWLDKNDLRNVGIVDVPLMLARYADYDKTVFFVHMMHVKNFLNEMYATMIDPIEQPSMTVAELCELLLKTARDQREKFNSMQHGS